MSEATPLDRLIRRISFDNKTSKPEPGEELRVFDATNGKILKKRPVFTLAKDLRHYLVTPQADIEWDGPEIALKNKTYRQPIYIKFSFLLSCPKASVDKITQALAVSESPSQALNERILDWFHDYRLHLSKQGIDLLDSLFEHKSQIENKLEEYLHENIGLQAECTLSVAGIEKLKRIDLEGGPITVRTCDSDEVLSVHFSAELDVRTGHEIKAVVFRDQQTNLSERFSEIIRSYFLSYVSFHEFHFDLHASIRDKLSLQLDEEAARQGRCVRSLRLTTPASRPDANTVEVNPRAECTIKKSDEKVFVKNTIRLQLVNLGKWKQSGFKDLNKWCDTVPVRIIQDRLFEKTYADIMLDFDKDEDVIKDAVRKAAEEVGYNVQHHIVFGDIEPLIIRDRGFEIELNETYETADFRVDVRLGLTVTGRIPDLRKIERILAPDINIKYILKDHIREVAARTIRGIMPMYFYQNFKTASTTGDISFEELLYKTIERTLRDEFGVTDIVIIPKILDTPLIQRIASLGKTHHSFDMRIESFDDAKHPEDVTFTVMFEIVNIWEHGWSTFLSKNYQSREAEIAAIEEVLRGSIQGKLATLSVEELRYHILTELQDLAIILESCLNVVRQTFGLVLRLINVRRMSTESEQIRKQTIKYRLLEASKTDQAIIKRESERVLSEYDELAAQRLELIKAGLPDDDVERVAIDRQIESILNRSLHREATFGKGLLLGGNRAIKAAHLLQEKSQDRPLLPNEVSSKMQIDAVQTEEINLDEDQP